MRVAIIHDWLVTNAGAEKVLKDIVTLYPNSDIFSLVDFLSDEQRDEIIMGKSVTTSFIQNLPFAKKHFRNYLPLFPKAIESLDLSGYDLIISSSWAVAKGVKKPNNSIHICYCHTPIRYAWDLYDEYTQNLSQPKKLIVQLSLKYIRKWDKVTSSRVDYFIANSNFVANRIKETYDRDSTVIYPPVNIEKFTLKEEKNDYYLTASRLVPYKKTKLIVEAFNQMSDKKLVVIGSGEELHYIKDIAQENIIVLGYQKDNALIEYMQNAKAFVYGAIEDFGIIPIEANACGTPVLALNIGGTAETIIDDINGLHFNTQTIEDIIECVNRFENKKFDANKVRQSTIKYSEFKNKFKLFIDEISMQSITH